MPRRTSTQSGWNWYSDTPNSFVRYPGGRALTSDVRDAGMRLQIETPVSARQPTVQVPRSNRSFVNPNERPLFADSGGGATVEFPRGNNPIYDPSNQWWKTPVNASAGAQVSHNSGGSIWSESGPPISGSAFAEPPNQPIQGMMEYMTAPGNEWFLPSEPPTPAVESELPGSPEFTEPGLLPPLQEYELPMPTDDSFLPRTGEPTVQVPRSNASSGGSDLNWMNGLSLGAYLGTSLSYPSSSLSHSAIGYGGRPLDLQPGEGWIDTGSQTGGHWVESAAGSTWVEDRSNALANPGANATTNLRLGDPFDERANMESNPDTRANASSNPQEPRERDVIYRDFIDPGTPAGPMTAEAYRQATFGGVTPTGYRDTRGSAAWDPRAANAMQMWYQSMGGTPNEMSRAIEGTSNMRFYHGDRMRINDEGGFELAGNFERDPFNTGLVGLAGQGSGAPHLTTDPESIRAYNAWIMSQRGRGGNSGVRGIPATSGGGG